MLKNIHIQMLQDTLNIFDQGYYIKGNRKIGIRLSREQIEECHVYLPDNIATVMRCTDPKHADIICQMKVDCRNIDTFSMAQEQYRCNEPELKNKRTLVLNFANPYNPGGGVRHGARAQEEDLCRKSSLLFSLESRHAQKYFRYNKSLNTYMASDSIILTPNVEVIKDSDGILLDEPFVVSVMTCAAPIIVQAKESISEKQYLALFYNRICVMLKCAAYWGYRQLVLGAFGCGEFGNDARIVSDLFYKALKEFDYAGMGAEAFFRRIDFAVLDNSHDKYNLKQFKRNFDDYYRDEVCPW